MTLDLLYKDEDFPVDVKGAAKIKENDIQEALVKLFKGQMYLNKGEVVPLCLFDSNLIITVRIDKIIGFNTNMALLSYGMIEDSEDLTILCKKSTASSQLINIESDRVELKEIIKDDFKSLGIGGLDKQFKEIFRRAFNSRRYPAHVLAKYDIKHVRGMLLYGPPGTGKTLIAR